MRISYITFCGFRGFQNELRIEFSPGFNIISGRNGVGKSTLCDAVEFVLTGTIDKYNDARAANESVSDYIWWKGKRGAKAQDNYVEVGFVDSSNAQRYIFKRSKDSKGELDINHMEELFIDIDTAPSHPLKQLCKSAIIRDESISAFSLDLSETERFKLFRDALGNPDADQEIERAKGVINFCSSKIKNLEEEYEVARGYAQRAVSKIEEIRSRMSEETLVKNSVVFLRTTFSSKEPVDKLLPIAREEISKKGDLIKDLESFLFELDRHKQTNSSLVEKQKEEAILQGKLKIINEEIDTLIKKRSELLKKYSEQEPLKTTKLLAELLEIGSQIGFSEGKCQLCNADHDEKSFSEGVSEGYKKLKDINAKIEIFSKQKRALDEEIREHGVRKSTYGDSLVIIQNEINGLRGILKLFLTLKEKLQFNETAGSAEIKLRILEEKEVLSKIEKAASIVDTLKLNDLLENAMQERNAAVKRIENLQAQLVNSRKAGLRSKLLYDSVRRAANEALDDRLNLINPLLGELFRRLRPHALWRDIEYNIRGDVTRMLRLKIGDGLNPQFMFSSGQRRATGLALLLSVYLSTSWNKLQTIILDDPVQHIDDFRAIHLSEVLAAVHLHGHQVICAVEDSSLANLLCRRLSAGNQPEGLHIELGSMENGALGVTNITNIKSLQSSIMS